MATPALSTLRHVTDRKLEKLAAQREKFEEDKKSIIARVKDASDPQSKVEALLEGFGTYAITARQLDVSVSNLERFVHQAKHDPSVSSSLLADWQSRLEHELDIVSAKYEYATLFGTLVIEWIKHPNIAATDAVAIGSDSDVEMSDSFDHVGRKEMHEQRREWEAYAFTKKDINQAKIESYLKEIFETTQQANKVKKTPLEKLRDMIKDVLDFKSDLQPPIKHARTEIKQQDSCFTIATLQSCIRGVLQSDLLAGQKRQALADLENQPAVLKELVDVLNMDLEGLDQWQWDPVPVPLNMRRQLNGKYRVYMDGETHQAILLHFVGKTWAVAFKNAFTSFYHSGVWLQSPSQYMDMKARQRREYFVPNSTKHPTTVHNYRGDMYQSDYFMTQLPNDADEDYHDYAAEDQPDAPAKAGVQSHGGKSHVATKQSMLRLVTTEMLLNTKVYGECLVLQSDFKWFGPSLPHDTIFAVLKFLGVPAKWLRFFKKFLEAPVVFAQDGLGAKAQVRKCGIPMSHVLSDALSEAVLFCLDFAVNRRTPGANIYRFHDDLWFWGQEKTAIAAWNAIQEFSGVMGLALNKDKTGAQLIVASKVKARAPAPALPQGSIKWGFLVLDPMSGRWAIDRNQVGEHIVELRRQLDACRSIMAWVQAWNTYVSRFFSTNFGQPANCFGRSHNDMIIDTFSHIQRILFADAGTANVTDYLRGMLKERFNTTNTIPDAFFYFPCELGGLGLRNPFITAFATYGKSIQDPGLRIDRAFEEEREEYERLKARWDAGVDRPNRRDHNATFNYNYTGNGAEPEDFEPFISVSEYTRYREQLSPVLTDAYIELLDCPPEEMVETSEELSTALRSRGLEDSPYWLWIYNLYAGDMKARFGGQGLQLGERDLLPVGLVDVLKGEKVRWEG